MKKLYRLPTLLLVAVLLMSSLLACADSAAPTPSDPFVGTPSDRVSNLSSDGNAPSTFSDAPAATNGGQPAASDPTLDPLVSEALDTKHTLRFNADGNFKILVFSDVQENYPILDETIAYMEHYLDTEKPDLVLFTGDNHYGGHGNPGMTKETMILYLTQLAEPMESRGIPWAQVYGNHAEGAYTVDNHVSKEEQQGIFESFDYNVSKKGCVSGVGNYVLPILRSDSDEVAYNVFCMDSHDYLYKYEGEHPYEDGFELEDNAILGPIYSGAVYDTIHMDQIAWYWDTSVALENYNGKSIPAMMMFHIPLWEMSYISENREQTGFVGTKGEAIQAPEINSGLFWALYERGDVKTVINGHCHVNDFQGEYMGITMAFSAAITGTQYFDPNTKGVRIVTINQDDAYNAETYMRYVKDIE